MKEENEGYEHRRGFELREEKIDKGTMEKRYREIWRMTCTNPDSNNLMYLKTVEFIRQELSSLVEELMGKQSNWGNGIPLVSVDDILEVASDSGVDI